MKKTVLSIAGFDPIGGAGLQADLKTFNSLGLHGVTVATCITIQNTKTVKEIYKIPIKFIEKQIDILSDDIKIDFVKIGLLYDKDIIHAVSKKIIEYDFKCVVDPVMSSTSGDSLSKDGFKIAFKEEIIPKSYVITPNIFEASLLTDFAIKNVDDVKSACKKIYAFGAKNVIVKGSHLKGDVAVDTFFDGDKFDIIRLPKIRKTKTHGSGCAFSSLITSFLAMGEKPNVTFRKTKNIIWNMIKDGYKIGGGSVFLNHSENVVKTSPSFFETEQHFQVWFELKNSMRKLLTLITNDFLAEVGMNFGFALPNAKSHYDICAIDGRIVKTISGPFLTGKVDFGASKHIASIILSSMNFDSSYRSAINIKYSDNILKRCKENNLSIGSFDRLYQNEKIESTMEWGTIKTISDLKFVPDIIFDKGGSGKEPMIRLLGKSPDEIISKITTISK